jgi:hypothetical protein
MSRKNDGRQTTKDYSRFVVDARDWRRRGMLPLLAENTLIVYPNKAKKVRDETVDLIWTPCNFGGWRVWFVCPKCEKKVAILYCAYSLGCRQCYDLKYESQNMDDFGRGCRKLNKLRKRFGWYGGFAHGEFGKPRNMYWKTYVRLHREYSNEIVKTVGGFKWKTYKS